MYRLFLFTRSCRGQCNYKRVSPPCVTFSTLCKLSRAARRPMICPVPNGRLHPPFGLHCELPSFVLEMHHRMVEKRFVKYDHVFRLSTFSWVARHCVRSDSHALPMAVGHGVHRSHLVNPLRGQMLMGPVRSRCIVHVGTGKGPLERTEGPSPTLGLGSILLS